MVWLLNRKQEPIRCSFIIIEGTDQTVIEQRKVSRNRQRTLAFPFQIRRTQSAQYGAWSGSIVYTNRITSLIRVGTHIGVTQTSIRSTEFQVAHPLRIEPAFTRHTPSSTH